jgi:hypothetical protein
MHATTRFARDRAHMAFTVPSSSLVRAAAAESERIERTLSVLAQRRAALMVQMAEVDAQASELHERQRLLGLLVSKDETPESGKRESRPTTTSSRTLKGRALRQVAGHLLWGTQSRDEIHYREWFERVLAAGYAVGGKDPAASFLTNMRDSPAVVRGSRAGYYRLDPSSRERLAQTLSETQAELADVIRLLDRARHGRESNDRADHLREHRDTLTQRLRRLEADIRELDAIFDEDSGSREASPNLRAA